MEEGGSVGTDVVSGRPSLAADIKRERTKNDGDRQREPRQPDVVQAGFVVDGHSVC